MSRKSALPDTAVTTAVTAAVIAAAAAAIPPLSGTEGAFDLIGGVWVKDPGSTREIAVEAPDETPVETPVEGMPE